MKNPRNKGRRAENELASILEVKGFLVEKVKGSTKFNKSVDFFGVFDIFAFNAQGFRFYQVKSNSTSGAIKQLTIWKDDNKSFLPDNVEIFVAVRSDHLSVEKRWRIIKI